MKGKFIWAIAGLVLGGTAIAQDYFEFGDIPGIDAQPSVQIDLSPQMLGFVTAAAGASGDPRAAEMLAGIEGVRVRVYEQVDDADAVRAFVDDRSSDLADEGWQSAISVQDGENRVRMFMRFDEDRVSGMTVMVLDDSEAVFINIAGVIDPVVLGTLTRQIGIDGMLDGVIDGVDEAITQPGG